MKSNSVFIEFRQDSLRLFDGESGLETALERTDTGRLSEASKLRAIDLLRDQSRKRQWRRPVALCAIDVRGVSLRVVTLPVSARQNLQEVLRLQIEKEFPLSPDALAWGYMPGAIRDSGQGGQDFLVIAVKKEIITEYAQLMASAGYDARFTLGILAGARLISHPPRGAWVFLDLQSRATEMISFRNGLPTSVRVIPSPGGEPEALALFSACIRDQCAAADIVYVSGSGSELNQVVPALNELLAPVRCEPVTLPQGDGLSVATLGLMRLSQTGEAPVLIQTEVNDPSTATTRNRVELKWAAIAIALLLALISLRYVEVFLKKSALERRVAEVKSARDKLPNLDAGLGFLQYLETNQAPYLQVISAVAEAAPRGTKLDGFTISRRGDVSMRGVLQNSQQAAEFRSKLIRSGAFSTVVLEEQTPAPDRRRLNFRLSARWNANPTSAGGAADPKLSTPPATNKPAAPITGIQGGHENIN